MTAAVELLQHIKALSQIDQSSWGKLAIHHYYLCFISQGSHCKKGNLFILTICSLSELDPNIKHRTLHFHFNILISSTEHEIRTSDAATRMKLNVRIPDLEILSSGNALINSVNV